MSNKSRKTRKKAEGERDPKIKWTDDKNTRGDNREQRIVFTSLLLSQEKTTSSGFFNNKIKEGGSRAWTFSSQTRLKSTIVRAIALANEANHRSILSPSPPPAVNHLRTPLSLRNFRNVAASDYLACLLQRPLCWRSPILSTSQPYQQGAFATAWQFIH